MMVTKLKFGNGIQPCSNGSLFMWSVNYLVSAKDIKNINYTI